jgi:hypothetical protein
MYETMPVHAHRVGQILGLPFGDLGMVLEQGGENDRRRVLELDLAQALLQVGQLGMPQSSCRRPQALAVITPT